MGTNLSFDYGKAKRLNTRCLRLIDIALARFEGSHRTYPIAVIVHRAARLRLHHIAIHRVEAGEGLAQRHARAGRESNPVVARVDGENLLGRVDRNACQRDLAG